MTGARLAASHTDGTVNTVLGPVPAHELGVVAVHEALLSVIPGARYGFDISIDHLEIFQTLARKLRDFRDRGGRTIVDATGMFGGRDVRLYETLSRTSGVHIVASTGMGPREMLGGYFLTPRNTPRNRPPTPSMPSMPWPAEEFADLFTKEITEGMVASGVRHRAAAGLVATAATPHGMTTTEENLVRGAARAALRTGVAVSIRYGADAVGDLEVVLDETLHPGRVVVAGLDRNDAVAAGAPLKVARRGAYLALDHVGTHDETHLSDAQRAGVVAELVDAGFGNRILLSSNATGKAVGHPGNNLPYSHILSGFVPLLTAHGLRDEQVRRILVDNPRELLTVR